MFGWRKKRDGFEWHEYVRTTILLRRVNRRRKVDAVQQAAIDGLKKAGRAAAAGIDEAKAKAASGLREAGEKGLSASGAGLSSVAGGVAGGFAAAACAAAGAGKRAAAGLGNAAAGLKASASHSLGSRGERGQIGEAIAGLSGYAAGRIGRQRSVPIGAAGVALAIAAAKRGSEQPADLNLLLLVAVAVVLLATAALLAMSPPADDDGEAAPPLRQGVAMAAWGGVAALAIFVLGPLLSAGTGGGGSEVASRGPSKSLTTGSLASDGRLEGHATALSGDTLRIRGRVLQLAEIEAPDRDQTCTRGSGTRWRCGEAAQRALERFTRRDSLSCEITKSRGDAPAIATCRTATGTDVGAEMVRGGHAFADTGFFASYSNQQDEARGATRGIWASATPQRPADYRSERWEAAKKSAPDGCPIKAQVSGRSRTYFMPWSAGYDRASVRKERGGRWFCSEEEARSAGWQPAERS